VLADWRASNFAGWLALLVEHGVPLADAVELASAATGDVELAESGRAIAARTRRGEGLDAAVRSGASARAGGLPPLLRWMIVAGAGRGELAPALRHAAETYRLRALRRAETLATTLPSVLLLVIGGSAAALYALTLFAPWTGLLESLARPRS
jgi:type II secretory pathway component PulF